MTIKLNENAMLSISAKREALLRKLVAAGRLVEAQLDWATNHASDADLEELLSPPARPTTPIVTSSITARQLAVARVLGGLTPAQLVRGVEGAAAKKANDDRDDDEADEDVVNRLAQLTRTKEGNAAKTKQKMIAKIGKAHVDTAHAERVTVDDLHAAARMAGITVPKLVSALQAKGWTISDTGHGWQPPSPDDDEDDDSSHDNDGTHDGGAT